MSTNTRPDDIFTPNTAVLEWHYAPSEFLEGFEQIELDNHVVQIRGERLYLRIPTVQYDDVASIKEALDSELRSMFAALQLVVRKPYTLRPPALTIVTEEGKHNIYVSAAHISGKSQVGAVDLIVTDEQGKVIFDSAAQRHARMRRLAELARQHRDDRTTVGLFASFDAAMRDPANELVYLYEIRERLKRHYGGESEAQRALNISRAQWREFGKLADWEPVKQGRHRGNHPLPLRDATEQELEQARDFVVQLIEGYLAAK